MKNKIIASLIIMILIVMSSCTCFADIIDEDDIKVWSSAVIDEEKENTETVQTSVAASEDNPLKLTSGAGILIEQNSGDVLYGYNMHDKLRPASVTKVMTILLIMEALDSGRISLADKVPCTEDAAAMRWFANLA